MCTLRIVLAVFFLLLYRLSYTQHDHTTHTGKTSNAVIIPGLGNHHHKVSTDDDEAQKFFDQGLTLLYAFNHNEAIRSFEKAAEIDPDLAMAYWGIAYAFGPNYNVPASPEQRKLAYDALKKAVKLSKNSSQKEKDYIKALTKRYTKDIDKIDQQSLNVEFKQTMKDLYLKYPDDVDAATLYAESLMNLKPWQLWNKDGTPAEGTEEIVSVLESVLKRDPDHLGANHYYIHAIEASNDPGRGLASAIVLKDLIPAAGHLVHMPAHIFFRVGDYVGASDANITAIKSDDTYLKNHKPVGIYPIMYYNHNINFLSLSRMIEGRYSDAIMNANLVAKNVKPIIPEMQMLEGFYANPVLILFSFGKWNDLIALSETDTAFKVYSALLYFSKAAAYATLGNIDAANKYRQMFLMFKEKVPTESAIGNTPANLVMNVVQDIMDAKIAIANGDSVKAIELLQSAVAKEDQVNYNEPPDWYPSVRLILGGALYRYGKFVEAEKVFRDELKKYPHNGRGLFGLIESLKAQKREDETKLISEEFQKAWKDADVQLSISEF